MERGRGLVHKLWAGGWQRGTSEFGKPPSALGPSCQHVGRAGWLPVTKKRHYHVHVLAKRSGSLVLTHCTCQSSAGSERALPPKKQDRGNHENQNPKTGRRVVGRRCIQATTGDSNPNQLGLHASHKHGLWCLVRTSHWSRCQCSRCVCLADNECCLTCPEGTATRRRRQHTRQGRTTRSTWCL